MSSEICVMLNLNIANAVGAHGFSCASVCSYISSSAFLSPPLGISLRQLGDLRLSSCSYLISDLESQSLYPYIQHMYHSLGLSPWIYEKHMEILDISVKLLMKCCGGISPAAQICFVFRWKNHRSALHLHSISCPEKRILETSVNHLCLCLPFA